MAISKTPLYYLLTVVSLQCNIPWWPNSANVVQMGILNKSVALDTISPTGGATRFEKLWLYQQLAAGSSWQPQLRDAAASNSFQVSHTFSSGNAEILVLYAV